MGNNMKSITVLCRGQSLKYINQIPNSDVVLMVNRFGDELEFMVELREYISNSEIYLCTSGSSGELDSLHRINFFNTYNPTKLIRPYLSSETNFHLNNSCELPNIFLSDVHKNWMYKRGVEMPSNAKYEYCYPSSGITALAYAVLETDCDVINIIGLDFYENSQYLTEPCHVADWGKDGHMQGILTTLVEKHPNKSFNMISTGEKHLDNVKKLTNMNFKKVGV